MNPPNNISCKLIELHFSQLKSLLLKLDGNEYPDERLFEFQDTLFKLFEKIELEICSSEFHLKNDFQLLIIKEILNFISYSIIYLQDSTLNNIPFETIYCLKQALKEWTDENYIIATSLQYHNYFFHSLLSFNEQIYGRINRQYKIQFKHKLIQISLPKSDAGNYLIHIVLYHELGHFINRKYNISNRVLKELKLFKEEDQKRILKLIVPENFKEIHSNLPKYLDEYFADIFAAQYINDSLIHSLNLVSPNNKPSQTHPSNKQREKVVNDFCNGNPNELIEMFKEATKEQTKQDLIIRFEEIVSDDIFHFLPIEIESNNQLHGLYVMGWDIWVNRKEKFEGMKTSQTYNILNNLIEKSISNYIITDKWQQNVSSKKGHP